MNRGLAYAKKGEAAKAVSDFQKACSLGRQKAVVMQDSLVPAHDHPVRGGFRAPIPPDPDFTWIDWKVYNDKAFIRRTETNAVVFFLSGC